MIAQFGFDTLAFVKRLSAAGMDTGQAEALAEALTGDAFNELATRADLNLLKADIVALEPRLNSKMENLESRLGAEMKSLELRLTIRMGVMLTAATAILGTLITLN